MRKKKLKYFHCSPKRFKNGQLLTDVFMTTSDIPHFTVFEWIGNPEKCESFKWLLSDRAVAWAKRFEKCHIYEVEPLQPIDEGKGWDEAFTAQAVVVRYVGNAVGIKNRYLRNGNPKKEMQQSYMGSRVEWQYRQFHPNTFKSEAVKAEERRQLAMKNKLEPKRKK